MGKELKIYCFNQINEVPHEVYMALLFFFCVGLIILIVRFGLHRGLGLSMRLLLVEYVFLLYASTVFFRTMSEERECEFIPFWSYRAIMDGSEPQLLSENIMNIMVFIPVGVLSGVVFQGMNWKKLMMIGAGLSVGIEVLQLVFRKGFSEVDDVIHNTLGCAIGYGLWLMIFRYVSK